MNGQFYSNAEPGGPGNPNEKNDRGVMNRLIGETRCHETGEFMNLYPSHLQMSLDELAQPNNAFRYRTLAAASINNNCMLRQNHPNIAHPNYNGLPRDLLFASHRSPGMLPQPENIQANLTTSLQAHRPEIFVPNLPIGYNPPLINQSPRNINLNLYKQILIQDLTRRRQQQVQLNEYMHARNIAEEELMLSHLKRTAIEGSIEKNSQNLNLSALAQAEDISINSPPGANTSILHEINRMRNDTIRVTPRAIAQESTTPPPEHNSLMKIFGCKARNMPLDHNLSTAYFMIDASTIAHGTPLKCSHHACRSQGEKFLYCAFCKKPAAKQNFLSRHRHCGDAK